MARGKTWEQHKAECEAVAKAGVTILGFIQPWKGNTTNLLCKCDKHGEWQSTSVDRFKRGRSCPICAKEGFTGIRAVSWEVHKAECEAVAKPGITIKGFIAPWKGNNTYLNCYCDKHGEWNTTTIASFKNGRGCQKCKGEYLGDVKRTSKQDRIDSFIETGAYTKGTTFNPIGPRQWEIYCPKCAKDEYSLAGVCNGVFKAETYLLVRGGLPCRCSDCYAYTLEQWNYRLTKECNKRGHTFIGFKKDFGNKKKFTYLCKMHGEQETTPDPFLRGNCCPECRGKNHKEAYISILGSADGWDNIKFGIARNSLRRVRDQQSKTTSLQVKSAVIYSFPTVKQCRAAERAVFAQLGAHVGSVSRELMPDGFTETLPISFMDQVIEIYKEHGGKLKPVSLDRPKRQKRAK